MLRICAWCKKQIGTVEQSVHDDDTVSHGICESCAENLTFQTGVSLDRYLDAFPEPIVAVDGRCLVQIANRAACRLLNTKSKDAKDRLPGDVFECTYARLPEGCGRTVHCSGCAIRHAVTDTFQTGKPHYRIPATLHREDPEHAEAIALFITTIKINDVVFLRIDRIGA